MKKIHLAVALIAALAAPSAFAQATDHTGFFVNGSVGSGNVSEGNFSDTGTAWQLNGGYRWGTFGIEGGYADFANLSDTAEGLDVNAALNGFTLGANGRFNFAEQWYLSGRAGFFFWDADANAAVCAVAGTNRVCNLIEADTDGTDYYVGFGLGYDFNEQFSLGVAYDYFAAEDNDLKLNTNTYSITGEVRF